MVGGHYFLGMGHQEQNSTGSVLADLELGQRHDQFVNSLASLVGLVVGLDPIDEHFHIGYQGHLLIDVGVAIVQDEVGLVRRLDIHHVEGQTALLARLAHSVELLQTLVAGTGAVYTVCGLEVPQVGAGETGGGVGLVAESDVGDYTGLTGGVAGVAGARQGPKKHVVV